MSPVLFFPPCFTLFFLFNHISKNFPCCCCLPFGMIIFASVFLFFIFHSHLPVTQFVGIRKFISHCVCTLWMVKMEGGDRQQQQQHQKKSENACVMYSIWEHKLHNMKMTTTKINNVCVINISLEYHQWATTHTHTHTLTHTQYITTRK